VFHEFALELGMTHRLVAWIESPRRMTLIIVLVLLLGSGWIVASAAPLGSTTAGLIPSPRPGFLAPDFELDLLGSGSINLLDLRGQVVVINLWASWCPPCRAEMPVLQRVYEDLQGEGLIVLGVHMTAQDSPANADAFVQELGLSFPVLLDRSGLVGKLYQSRALPTTFFVDRDGVIQEVVVGGPLNEVTLRSYLQPLLAESK
jgi:cytochrome c biogenesis protein CcmG/thiol:disulfide interchange protein DsbE